MSATYQLSEDSSSGHDSPMSHWPIFRVTFGCTLCLADTDAVTVSFMLAPTRTVAEVLALLRSCNKYLVLQKRTISFYLYISRTQYHVDSLGRMETLNVNEYWCVVINFFDPGFKKESLWVTAQSWAQHKESTQAHPHVRWIDCSPWELAMSVVYQGHGSEASWKCDWDPQPEEKVLQDIKAWRGLEKRLREIQQQLEILNQGQEMTVSSKQLLCLTYTKTS